MRTWQQRVNEGSWDKETRELFFRFIEKAQIKRRPIGERRIEKYRTDLIIAGTMTGTKLGDMLKDMKGLEKAVRAINADKAYSFETKRDAKRTLGSLYNFKHTGDMSLIYAPKELKELVSHIASAKDRRLAKEIITRLEMREMLRFGNTLDKAMISLLFESGMRMGEFSLLKKSDIRIIDEGLEIRCPAGKTGERMIVVVEATRYVTRWLEEHPDKSNDCLLWVSTKGGNPLGGPGMAKRIRMVAERLNEQRKKEGLPGFTKPINPHNFRHSRASELGGEPGMTEQLLCKYFGWEIGSSMPRVYLHLTNDQVRKAILRTYGKARKEEEKEIITHRVCPKCSEENPLSLNFCGKCGQPLDSDKQITRIGELEEKMKMFQSQLEELKKSEKEKFISLLKNKERARTIK